MTDNDARILRTTIAKYGFGKVILELTRVAKGWSLTKSEWEPVVSALKRVGYTITVRRIR